MNAALSPDPSTPVEGGFYAGRILIAGVAYALIVAPKAEGEHEPIAWHDSYDSIPGALSYNDGLVNTAIMCAAGSKLAKWAQGLTIGGFSDWYLPSLDELEVCYRAFKPTTEANYCWARSGINMNSVPAAPPYTPGFPQQTENELFRAGAVQAFEEAAYWSSTQHVADSSDAWFQDFYDGYQGYWGKVNELRARAVRRLAI
jgi:hypothetical protein